MSFFLANRVVTGESLWQNILPLNSLHASDRWILLYGNAKTEETKQAVIAANRHYENLSSEARSRTVFVYMDVPGDKTAVQQLADSVRPKIQCMPGYLSRGYSSSFDHLGKEDELPLLVEVASSGRILDRVNGVEEVTNWLSKPE
jgi:hypothetical protein